MQQTVLLRDWFGGGDISRNLIGEMFILGEIIRLKFNAVDTLNINIIF